MASSRVEVLGKKHWKITGKGKAATPQIELQAQNYFELMRFNLKIWRNYKIISTHRQNTTCLTCSTFLFAENIRFSRLCVHVCLLPSGASASELVLQCTPEGIRLQCYMSYYTEEMKTVWKHKYSSIKIFIWRHLAHYKFTGVKHLLLQL